MGARNIKGCYTGTCNEVLVSGYAFNWPPVVGTVFLHPGSVFGMLVWIQVVKFFTKNYDGSQVSRPRTIALRKVLYS